MAKVRPGGRPEFGGGQAGMFRSGRLEVSEHGRPLWVMVALSVLLLAWVSIGHARMADPATAIGALERDLAALRLQLDGVEPRATAAPDGDRALDTDLGDGGEAFRRRSLLTVARIAGRHLERLIVGYRHAAHPTEARRAEALRLDLVELQHRLAHLARSADPIAAEAAHRDARQLLDRLDRALARIIADDRVAAGALPGRRSGVTPGPDAGGG